MKESIINWEWSTVACITKRARIMKRETSNQELLLFSSNSFNQRQFHSSDENGKNRRLSIVEELEKACLDKMFPEI